MARIQIKIWHAPLSVLSSPPPTGLAEGEVAIAIETNTFVKRPDGDNTGALISLNGDSSFLRVRAASTGPLVLSGLQTIDNVFLNAGEIILVKDNANAADNGVYVAAVGAWTRFSLANTTALLAAALLIVEAGTSNGDSLWICTTNRDAGAIGTAAITFAKPAGTGSSSTVTASSIGAVSTSLVGAVNGIASLGADGKLTAAQVPTMLTSSATVLGGVKVGSGLAIDAAGVLSTTGTGGTAYTLPISSATVLGGVKVGTGLAVDAAGVLSSTITAYTLPAATATVLGGVKSGSGLTNTAGLLAIAPATASVIGGVSPGTGLAVTAAGALNLNTATTSILGGVTASTGLAISAVGALSVAPATTTVVGGVSVSTGLAVSAAGALTLGIASATVLGGVKVGSGLAVDAAGVLSTTGTGGTAYTLPAATASALGGVKVGTGLAVDAAGVLSATGTATPTLQEFTVQFSGANPLSVSGLPTGWTASVVGTVVTVTHTMGKALKTIQFWGYSVLGGIERYRLPTGTNEAYITYADRLTKFSFNITTSISGADTDSTARVIIGF